MWILDGPRSTAGSCLVETARHGNKMMVVQAMVDPCCFRGHCHVPSGVVVVPVDSIIRRGIYWKVITISWQLLAAGHNTLQCGAARSC